MSEVSQPKKEGPVPGYYTPIPEEETATKPLPSQLTITDETEAYVQQSLQRRLAQSVSITRQKTLTEVLSLISEHPEWRQYEIVAALRGIISTEAGKQCG